MKRHFPLLQWSLPVVSIVFAGLLPVIIRVIWQGGLNAIEIGALQSVDRVGQLALMLSLFTIKPIYMFLCVVLLLTLWGRSALYIYSLFWGMAAFLMGELICGATYATFGQELIISEHIHSYGMVLEFIFIAFVLIELLDRHVLKEQARFRPLPGWILIAGMIISLFLLSVSTSPGGYHVDIFGYSYTYIRFEFNQWVESRVIPIMSFSLFLWALIIFKKSKQMELTFFTKKIISVGAGLLLFSMLRLSLGAFFADQLVWFEFGEEITQLVLISTMVFAFWKLKREWMMEHIILLR